VFVPRPETESVVQYALDALQGVPAPLCVDLCTGSGTIAFALANELPGAVVHASSATPTRWRGPVATPPRASRPATPRCSCTWAAPRTPCPASTARSTW
jgi:hypothetical protein